MPNYPSGKFFKGYSFFGKYNEDYKGVSIKRIPIIPRGSGNIILALNFISFILSSCLFMPFRLRDKYDLSFVYEPSPITVCIPAILLKKIRKIPIIFWVQDLWPESLSATGVIKSKLILNFVSKIVKFIYHACDLILVQSRAFTPSVQKFGVELERICYFPNSAEKLYKPIEDNSLEKYKEELPDGFLVIFAGNLGAAQSIETIVESAELIKADTSIKWIIIGNGRKKSWLEHEVQKRGLANTVYILGQRPVEDMPYYFSASDVLLATLKNDPIFALTIPSKIQSYLACGKPILAAIDGETASVINESGAGIAVPAENPQDLAKAVQSLYKMHESKRKLMGSRGRAYFEEHFESKTLLNQLENWIVEIS